MPEEAIAGDLALACCSVLVSELLEGGLGAACVSPGSRSTPVALALARSAGVPVHVHLDERSSAFFALGLARATGRPVAVVCTSGTAVPNLFPAVVEAAMSHAPLVLLTADRPPELRGVGANQTIDQVGMFGAYARFAADAPVPEAGAGPFWRSLGARAVAEAAGPPPGPVHLNLPFREPLVPTGTPVDLGPDAPPRPSAAFGEGPDEEVVADVAGLLLRHERSVVLAGGLAPAPPDRGEATASFETLGRWPVLAEPHAEAALRRPALALAAGQHLLSDPAFVRANPPEVVLQVGAPPTSRAGQALAALAGTLVVVAAEAGRSDPSGRPARHVDADPRAFLRALARSLPPPARTEWAGRWRQADRAARAAVDAVLDGNDEPFEGRVARDLFAAMPDGSTLFAGSSMPIRDLDAYALPRAGGSVRVMANRGASGIDGSVSTVLGIAASGAPTFGLIGDLALLHDAAGLLWAARRGRPAVFVVPNNRGGGIFDLLPQAALPEHEDLFVTPHRIDLSALATAAGAGHSTVYRGVDLPGAVRRAAMEDTVHVVEVPIDRAAGIRFRLEVREAVRTALAGIGYP